MVTDSWIDMASRRTPLKRAASASSLVLAVRFDALDPLGHRVRSCGAAEPAVAMGFTVNPWR